MLDLCKLLPQTHVNHKIVINFCSVEKHLTDKGWRKADDYTLKWTELKHSIDYRSFREGEQLVNHFPNINVLTTKIGLLESLRTFYRTQR
jgi:hypothetical protein